VRGLGVEGGGIEAPPAGGVLHGAKALGLDEPQKLGAADA
jgi:hypothetical protein